MSHPRISVFAGQANGNAKPVRVIEGQATLMARTIHDLGMDSVHDEIVVPNPSAQAILFFRGGANGEEKPLRVIQGPNTLLDDPGTLTVDPEHGEVFVPEGRKNAVLVFPREGNGNVAPLRILQGSKTMLSSPKKVAVDSANGLLFVVAAYKVLVFHHTDAGDVAPQFVLEGPKTGMDKENPPYKVIPYPEGKKMFVAIRGPRSLDGYLGGMVAVWNYGDQGDVAPWAVFRDTSATKTGEPFAGITLNPEAKEIIATNNKSPASIRVYRAPELFQ